MAWNYNQYTPSTNTDIMTAIKTFALLCGWSIDKETADELYLSSTGESGIEALFFSFKTGTTTGSSRYINCYGNTSFNGSLTWDNQPGNFKSVSGSRVACIAVLNTGNLKVDCFGNKDCLYFVVEPVSKYFQFLFFGKLDRLNIGDNEQQFVASTYSGYNLNAITHLAETSFLSSFNAQVATNDVFYAVRYDSTWKVYPNILPTFCVASNGTTFQLNLGQYYHINIYTGKRNSMYNDYTSYKYAFHTAYLSMNIPSDTNHTVIHGLFKNVFYTSYYNLSSLNDEVTFGAKTFKLFPDWYLDITTNSHFGIAIRKV